MEKMWFPTVIWIPPVFIVLIPGRQRPALFLGPLARLLVGVVELLLLADAGVGADKGVGLERADGVVRRDVGRVVGRAEAGGAGVVEGVCEFLGGGDVEEFADFGALGFADGFLTVSFLLSLSSS
jgi:hypothetical protein